MEGEECKTNEDAKSDEQRLNHLLMDGQRLIGDEEENSSTHNSALIVTHSQPNHRRFEQSEQTQQDQIRRVLVPLPVDKEQAGKATNQWDPHDPRVGVGKVLGRRQGEKN